MPGHVVLCRFRNGSIGSTARLRRFWRTTWRSLQEVK